LANMNIIANETYKPLGVNGFPVSTIGLGTVKFGRNTDVKYPKEFLIPDDNEISTLLKLCIDLGINLIDTAPAYGNSESRIGKLLPGNRDEWYIATKVGEYYEAGQSHFDFSAKTTQKSIENSLKNLNTDYVDLVSIHSNGEDESIINETDIFDILDQLKIKGMVNNIGMSTKTVSGGLKALEFVDVVMVELNYEDQGQSEVIKKAQSLGKGVLIKKALTSGRVADPSTALHFAANFPGVTSVILGTINPQHLRQNVSALTSI
jgi:aryl-alcohol dehydrogenase-like predicted oxidoreductase